MSKQISSRQLWMLIKMHAQMAVIVFVFGFIFFAGVLTSNIAKMIFSAITSAIYFLNIYNVAYKISLDDKKSITKETPFKSKGILLGLGLIIVTALIYALYVISWKFATVDDLFVSSAGVINNFLFIIWTFPFSGFLNLANGQMVWYGYLVIILIPLLACFLGYFAGFVGFDLYSKYNELIYEKKNTKENKND